MDNDLMILDELVGDCTIPIRNWDSIINLYNSENKSFNIPSSICSKIIEKIKSGLIPKMIFREYGTSYASFTIRYKNLIEVIEDIANKAELSQTDIEIVNNIRRNPLFLLGQDIDRAVAFHFNTSLMELKELSAKNPQAYKDYMKLVHPDEFEEKREGGNVEVIIKIAPGLIEAI